MQGATIKIKKNEIYVFDEQFFTSGIN